MPARLSLFTPPRPVIASVDEFLCQRQAVMPLPQMKRGSGTVLGAYRVGPYTAMLIRDAESAGPIKYFYMLSVTAQGGTSPTIVVTLEHNEMQGDLLRTRSSE